MRKRIFILILSVVLLYGFLNRNNIEKQEVLQTRNPIQQLTTDDLEGDWKFVHAEMVENTAFLNQLPEPQPIVDETPLVLPPYKGPDLHFEKDSMYKLAYPISINDRLKFSIDSGYLITYSGHQHVHRYPIEKKNDTLCIYKFHNGQ